MILYGLSYKKLRKLAERANLYEKTYNPLTKPPETPIFIRKIVQLPRYYNRMHNSCTKFRIKHRRTSFNLALALMSSASFIPYFGTLLHVPFLTACSLLPILLLVPTAYLATTCYCFYVTAFMLLLLCYRSYLTAYALLLYLTAYTLRPVPYSSFLTVIPYRHCIWRLLFLLADKGCCSVPALALAFALAAALLLAGLVAALAGCSRTADKNPALRRLLLPSAFARARA